jgi:hypothetical protein
MSSALARYEGFLVNNVSVISSLESSLRSVTWILPGRFKDAELASEACVYADPCPRIPPDFCASVCVAEHHQSVPRHTAQQGHAVGSQVQAPYPIFSPLSIHPRVDQKGREVQVVRTNSRSPSLRRAVDRNGPATENLEWDPLESRDPYRMRQVRPRFLSMPYPRILILIPKSLGQFYV